MRIVMLGCGYVGLVSGACFSEFGYEVICVDTDEARVEDLRKGIMPIYEPGLEDLVMRNVRGERLFFETSLAKALQGASAVFIAVGTPSRRGDGHADLSYVFKAAEEIADNLSSYAVVVVKSTVPVGTGAAVKKIIRERNPGLDFDMASNPEFLREGSAINDFMRPDRVVIGAENERTEKMMRRIYRPLNLNETPLLFTSIESSELAKYAANAFLAVKVAYINEIANLCEKTGADVHSVAKAIGLDKRIGAKFLHPGPGYGGSCFPKDTRALLQTAKEHHSPISIVEAAVNSNEVRKSDMAARIVKAMGGQVKGRIIGVLGLSFKPNTDDVRESPALAIVQELHKQGAYIKVFDPAAMHEAQKIIGNYVEYCDDAYDAIFEAEALVIVTEWNEFRSLDLKKTARLLKNKLIIDLRNIYKPEEMEAEGFSYISLGRRMVK